MTLTKSQFSCSLWGTNSLILKTISQSSTELWPKIGFNHIWRSVGHLESDVLDKKSQVFILRYQHTKFEVNVSIQYWVMAQNRFRVYMAVSRPSWIRGSQKDNSAVHFEVLNIILQFQLNPSSGSLVIAGEKTLQTDPDRQTDRTKTYMPPAWWAEA